MDEVSRSKANPQIQLPRLVEDARKGIAIMTAREEILSRIRTALPGDPLDPASSHASIPRLYNRAGTLTREARLELFIDRLLDYDTEIIQRETAAEIPAAIIQTAGEERLVTPQNFPAE